MALIDREVFRGYNISADRISFGDTNDVETTASPATETLVAALETEDDEIYRVGQGDEATQEYARGRLQVTLDDGSGNEPADDTVVELVVVSGQNNVQRTIKRGKYGQFKQGTGGDGSEPLPEQGPVVSDPKKIGVRVQAGGSSSFTVDTSASTLRLDAVRGER